MSNDLQLQPDDSEQSPNDELQTLFETSNLVVRQRDLKRAFAAVLDGLQNLVPYDTGAVHYHKAEEKWLETVLARGRMVEWLAGAKIPYTTSLIGRSLQTKEPLKIDNTFSQHDNFPLPGAQNDSSEALLVAPLQVDENNEGWALAIGRLGRVFSEREFKLFRIFATYAQAAIENARLYEVALRETEALRRVNVIMSLVGSLESAHQIYQRVAQEIALVMDYDRLTITEIDHENQSLSLIFDSLALKETGKETPLRTQFSYAGSATEKAVKTGRCMIRNDTADSSSESYTHDSYMLENGTRSYVILPLRHEEQINRIMMVHSSQPYAFDQAKLSFLEILAGQLAVVAENVNLFERLRRTRRQWQITLDSISDAVLLLKASDLTILQVNRAAAELAAARPEELVGQNYRDIFYGVDPCLCNFPPMEQLQSPGSMFTEEANGTFSGRIYQRSIYPIFDSYGALSELVTHVREVTATKMMEQQLAQNARLKAVGEMAAGIAHDFNNSLAGILGNVELMLTEVNDPQLRSQLVQLKQAALDGADTVRRIQSFGRKDGRKAYRKFELNSIVREVVELTRPRWQNQAQQQGIYIGMVLKLREHLTVFGNPAEVKEAITNLLFNALDAMSEGGTLTLTSYKEQQQGEWSAVLKISDTGHGIPEHLQAKIFDPFFTTKGLKGTGLGLSMARQIMAEHEGEINFESTSGEGTTFCLRFPLVQPDRVRSLKNNNLALPSKGPVAGSHSRVLIIDDDRTLCGVLQRILQRAGHTVDLAWGGKQGLEIFRANLGEFDMVFTDLSMPEMSGYEVARVMKSLDPQVIIILMTGWGADLNPDNLASRGIDLNISKPYRLTDIDRILEEAYELRRQGKVVQFTSAQELAQ